MKIFARINLFLLINFVIVQNAIAIGWIADTHIIKITLNGDGKSNIEVEPQNYRGSSAPGCSLNSINQTVFIIPANEPGSQEDRMYTALYAAHLTNKKVSLYGNGTCPSSHPNREQLDSIQVAD